MAIRMQEYIAQQPAVWQRIQDNYETLGATVVSACVRAKRLLLVGSGSSFNAAKCAQYFFEEALGLETIAVTSTGASAKARVLPASDTVALVISQSGRSTNTEAAIDLLKAKGFSVVSVTAGDSSPVAQSGDVHLLIDCGEENVPPKTKGMTATVLTLYLAGLAIARAKGILTERDEAAFLEQFRLAFRNAQQNLVRCTAFCRKHLDLLAAQPHFTLVSDGAGYPSALENALKVLETLYVPATAYEFEEYLHGVNNTIGPGALNLLLPNHAENLARMQMLAKYGQERGCAHLTITTLEAPESPDTLQLLGCQSPYAAPFETMLFFQVLSALGSERKGIDCDKPKDPGFYQAMQTKSNSQGV